MDALYLALIGLPVGLALDALIVRLAVAPGDEEDAGAAEDAEASHRPLAHAEKGSLVLEEASGQAWLRRAAVVAATAGLFALAATRFQEADHRGLVAAYVTVLLVCAATDAFSFRVPNAVTYPAMLGALLVGAFHPEADLAAVVGGGALAGGVLLLPALLTGGVGMGMGDVKLAAFVGLAVGFSNVVPALLVMALGGGAGALLLLVTGARKRGEPIPYAPFISAGGLATLFWQGAAFVSLS